MVRCSPGHRWRYETMGERCMAINECLETPDICHDGICYDTTDSYVCECHSGYDGPTCAERRELAAAYVNTPAILVIIFCALLLLCKSTLNHLLYL